MPDSAGSAPFHAMTDAELTTKLSSVLVSIWIRPHAALESLAYAPSWSWVVPIGCALALFYLRLFTLAFLNAPITLWTLLGGVGSILLGWPLRALALTGIGLLVGVRLPFATVFTLSTWATLPLTLRDAIQVIYMLGTGKLVSYPGLSGLLVEMDATNWLVRVGEPLLGWLDLFTFWHLGLLMLAISIGAQVTTRRAMLIVTTYSVLTLVLSISSGLL